VRCGTRIWPGFGVFLGHIDRLVCRVMLPSYFVLQFSTLADAVSFGDILVLSKLNLLSSLSGNPLWALSLSGPRSALNSSSKM
jgi:hypothetical protein